jgi:hypothetical protein
MTVLRRCYVNRAVKLPEAGIAIAISVSLAACRVPSTSGPPPAATQSPTTPADVNAISAIDALPSVLSTPTMSPQVAVYTARCTGIRVGAPIIPPRLMSARYDSGFWTIELSGQWTYSGPPFNPPGEPTREPWRDRWIATTCRMKIDALSAQPKSGGVGYVTATPPATPTMSPEVERIAFLCDGYRIGPAVVTPHIRSARFDDGVWTIEVDGLWTFYPHVQATVPGGPADERWHGQEFVDQCVISIDAKSERAIRSGGRTITATPPVP